ncbi:MAG: quinone-dependent dihydroorotate dehydrogenase [Myxococcota bacterium]|nr:quinone-dependent dihydroorotate dehydrogenase [Myxococcota bacterium]
MYRLVRRLLFLLKPESAHHFALGALHFVCAVPGVKWVLKQLYHRQNQTPQTLLGHTFLNPIGIAAGFDKNGEHIDVLSCLGFGFIEIGSATARPAVGNPQPRLFRLKTDHALINRMGLNNQGAKAISDRLSRVNRCCPLFVNIAKTHDPTIVDDLAIDDYCESVKLLVDVADVLVINVSCPNSGDGRTFEDPDALGQLLPAIRKTIGDRSVPYLVKVSPDLSESQLQAVVRLAIDNGAAGFTATNTTVSRDRLNASAEELAVIGAGGLSGRPLHSRALKTVENIRSMTDLPIIAVGGISRVEHAQAFIDAGASLVQLYSGFIYEGPSLVRRIAHQLRL